MDDAGNVEPNRRNGEEATEYDMMAELEDLESLLEELEEAGLTGFEGGKGIPRALRQRMDHYDVRDVQQTRDRIRRLHARLDEDESDITVSDS